MFTDYITSGDFRQCLPVVPRASRTQIVAATLTHSIFWKDVHVLRLTINMRLLADSERMSQTDRLYAEGFAAWLLQVGEGRLDNSNDSIIVKLPTGSNPTCNYTSLILIDIQLSASEASLNHLINKVYPDIEYLHLKDENHMHQYFSERVILTARNADVDIINDSVMNQLSGEAKTYLSADVAFQDGGVLDSSMLQEYLNTINLPGMPLHNTTLKVGCPIILIRNLEPAAGLCNGTRMIIMKLKERVIEATILMGSHAGKHAFIPQISLDTSASSGLPFTLRRRQFPFRSAFSMTVNKCQGQSLHIVGLHLLNPVFAHGQLYVALSRCTDCRNLHILLSSDADGSTDNVVYKEVLM